METVFLLVEAALVAALGTWMAVAVLDNWRHPRMNEHAVAMVVRFDLMAEEYPEDYRLVAHRRIDDPWTIRLLFRCMRLAETIAAVALFAASLLLLLATLGTVGDALARAVAVLATCFFTLIWGAFVIGGNYFAYWYCHHRAQSNHFMLMFWGLLVLLILMI